MSDTYEPQPQPDCGYGPVPPNRGVDVLPAIDPSREIVIACFTTCFVAVLGAGAGLLWHAVAPKMSVAALVAESGATFHPQIGADAWFLLIGALGGVVATALTLLVTRPEGVGLAVGLGLGGTLAAVIADRVGFLSDHQSVVSALHALGAHHLDPMFVSEVDFRVRAVGVLMAWPIASLALLMIATAVSMRRR